MRSMGQLPTSPHEAMVYHLFFFKIITYGFNYMIMNTIHNQNYERKIVLNEHI